MLLAELEHKAFNRNGHLNEFIKTKLKGCGDGEAVKCFLGKNEHMGSNH